MTSITQQTAGSGHAPDADLEPDLLTERARATWTSGDFGRIAKGYQRGAAGFFEADARTMLIEGKLELSTIARQCGFSHQSHFTSRFRQATGFTPTRWRKAMLSQHL